MRRKEADDEVLKRIFVKPDQYEEIKVPPSGRVISVFYRQDLIRMVSDAFYPCQGWVSLTLIYFCAH
jgi:hypothetical protein